jgi:LCP family protein required for cell wall assembly
MGLDYGDWASPDRDGPPRTDTMLLLTVDPVAKTAGMINIPRDMWVSIPGFSYGKINTAYPLGEAYQYPGGGPGLAMKTVELFLGVPIQYYAQIDFYAFEKFIDEIGGLTIKVPERITVDPIGSNNTVVIQPGTQTLSGAVALGYARQRDESAGVEGGDFARGNRQMKIILAIRNQILQLNMLPTLAAKAPTLYNELKDGIHTNLSMDQMVSLAWLAQSIPAENIKKGVITASEVNFASSPDGAQSILKPISSKIRMLRDEVFSSLPTLPQDDLETLMKDEQARLSVLNGSGGEGLADRTGNFLKSKGANVVNTGNAQYSDLTTIVDHTGKPYTVRYLTELMKVQESQIKLQYDPNAQVDVEVYLGADWANSNSLP